MVGANSSMYCTVQDQREHTRTQVSNWSSFQCKVQDLAFKLGKTLKNAIDSAFNNFNPTGRGIKIGAKKYNLKNIEAIYHTNFRKKTRPEVYSCPVKQDRFTKYKISMANKMDLTLQDMK